MVSVHRLLRRAVLWLHLRMWLNALAICTTVAASGMVVVRLIERLLGFPMDWSLAWIIALSGALVCSLVWTFVARRSRVDVARVLDDRASLRETLSTALCVENLTDPWSRAAVGQAEVAARTVRVLRTLPAPAPRRWGAPLAVAGLFFVAGFVPQFDLLKLVERAEATQAQAQQVIEAQTDARAAEDLIKDAVAKMDDPALRDLDTGAPEPTAPDARTPQEIRLEAIKKLTTMQDRLAELRSGEKAQALDELKKKMMELKQPRGPELANFSRELQKGNFEAAKKSLEELAQKMADGSMSEEQKKELAEQMKKLAEQLNALAKDRKKLEDKLREAGLDSSLASDPEALKSAMEKMEGLTAEQKQSLMQLAEATSKACEACKSVGGAMSKAAQQMAGGGDGGMGELGGELSALEMMQQDMDSMDAISKAVKDRLAGLGKKAGTCSGDESSLVPGSGGRGGPGIGNRDSAETDIAGAKKIKAKSETQQGPIIGTTLVSGDQVIGESAQEFSEAVAAGQASAAEAIESKRIPKELEEVVKQYFGRLEKKAPGAKDSKKEQDQKPSEPKEAPAKAG